MFNLSIKQLKIILTEMYKPLLPSSGFAKALHVNSKDSTSESGLFFNLCFISLKVLVNSQSTPASPVAALEPPEAKKP